MAGVSVLWDLNAAVVTLGYDHFNWIALEDRFEYLDRSAEILNASVAFTPNSTMSVGPEASYIDTSYDQNVMNDSQAFSAGAFLETQITNNLKVRVAGGYQNIDFDNTGLVNDAHNLDDYYANLLLSHRVNSAFNHTISAGHEAQLGVNSNYVVLNYVRHTANWNILLNTLLSTELFYEDAEDSGGAGPAFVPGPGAFLLNPFRAENVHALRWRALARLSAYAARHARISLPIHKERLGSAPARLQPESRFSRWHLQFLRRQLQLHENLGLHIPRCCLHHGADDAPGAGYQPRNDAAPDSQGRCGRARHHQHGHANQFHGGARRQEEARL